MFIHFSMFPDGPMQYAFRMQFLKWMVVPLEKIVVDMLLILVGNEQIEKSRFKQPFPTRHLHLHVPSFSCQLCFVLQQKKSKQGEFWFVPSI